MSGAAHAPEDRVVASVRDWSLLMRLVRSLAPYRGLVVVQFVALALVSLLQVAQPLLVRDAIDRAIPQKDLRLLFWLVAGTLALALLEFATRWAQALATITAGQGVVRDLRMAAFRKIVRLPQRTFDTTPLGRLMVRATSDVESLEEMFSSGVVTILGDLLKLALLVAVMLRLDVSLTLASLAIVPLFVVASEWFRTRLRDAFRTLRSRLSHLNGYLNEVLQGIRVVRTFGQEPREVARFVALNDELLERDLRSIRLDSAYSALVEMLSSLALAALLWWGGGEVVRDRVTFGTLFAFLAYAQQFFGPLQDLSSKYSVLQSAMASSERVFALLDAEDETTLLRSPREAPVPVERGAVELRDVTFAYGAGAPALHGVSLSIRPGSRVAIVGPTGSGKTTILRLLLRLHDVPPGAGAVIVDGVDVREWPVDALRGRVGLVPQDSFLFSGTVRDNLFSGGGEARAEERAMAAIHAAGADEVVARLGGLDGLLRERGSNVSHGERQLLALARAFVQDPAILVLDEATASIDSMSERRVQEALRAVQRGRTSITIAHRLSTVRDGDVIFVLSHGMLREQGTHEELMRQGGLYAAMWQAQGDP